MKQLQQQLLKSKNTHVLPFPASVVPCPLQRPATSLRQRRSSGGGTRWRQQGEALGPKAVAGCRKEQEHQQQYAGSRWGKPRGERLPPVRVTISRPQGRAGQGPSGQGPALSNAWPQGQDIASPAPSPAVAMGTAAAADPLSGTGSRPDLRILLRYRAPPRR